MEEPPLKISVATVTYNASAAIARTIECVESQTYPYIEHIIVDGNSQDDTLAHVHHYQERNSIAEKRHEISCISEPDEGLYDAMNKAIDMATGDYIVFLNAGDKLHAPDTLERIAEMIAKGNQPAVVYGDTDIVDDEGHFIRHRRLSPPERLNWRSFRSGMLVCHQAFYVRTDLARANKYNLKYRFSADFDWCIRIMRAAKQKKLSLLNTHLILADYLHEGLTTLHHQASLKERFRIMVRHYGLLSTLLQHGWFVLRSVLKR